ncbi:AB hydrolase superfamily protein [Abortiporus biennis]
MDPSLYRTLKTSRGYTYSYFVSTSKSTAKPTLLFLHGFPSTSYDWHYQAQYFASRGHGVIIPDMLGYGGSDKPTDPLSYRSSLVTRDLIEILDKEGIKKVVGIGHDLGCLFLSRLASYFPERISAYAFFAGAYIPVYPDLSAQALNTYLKARHGYDIYGYWFFFNREDAGTLIEKNFQTFFSIMYPHEPSIWRTHMGPMNAFYTSVLNGETFKKDKPDWMSEEHKNHIWESLRVEEGGEIEAPLSWYKLATSREFGQDDSSIPQTNLFPPSTSSIFFGAAKQDCICVSTDGVESFETDAWKDHKVTIREYEGDHWLILSCHEEVDKDLEEWIGSLL